jgi:hypothetical protein
LGDEVRSLTVKLIPLVNILAHGQNSDTLESRKKSSEREIIPCCGAAVKEEINPKRVGHLIIRALYYLKNKSIFIVRG